MIARFTKRALLDKLPKQSGPKPSQAVIGAFLYICRQLYNTCEGLLVLYQYELHKVVAEAWREVCLLFRFFFLMISILLLSQKIHIIKTTDRIIVYEYF